jgi:hypothetical protein
MKSEYLRKSRLAAGIGLVLLVMLFETVHVHRVMPSPHSPLVWTLLGVGAIVALVYAAWAKRRSLAAADD